MADFQFLPMTRTDNGSYRSLHEELLLQRVEPRSWILRPAPIHILPTFFSRVDSSVEYCFRDDPKTRSGKERGPKTSEPNFIGAGSKAGPVGEFQKALMPEAINCRA